MRAKIGLLEEAFNGHFDNHHAFLLTRMLGRIDAIDADIAAVDAQIEAQLAPFAAAAARLDDIPGVGPVAAAIILAEVGVEMSRFPTAGHLCSWAKFSPGICSSAGKSKGNGSSGHAKPSLVRVLGEAAVVVGRTDTFLGERYRRIAKRRGKKRAIVAVGRSILVIVWHLLSDEQAVFNDLGAGVRSSATSTPRPRSATTSANWRPSATPSASSQRRKPHTGHHYFRIRRYVTGRDKDGAA